MPFDVTELGRLTALALARFDLCKHCKQQRHTHATDEKCLFDATYFEKEEPVRITAKQSKAIMEEGRSLRAQLRAAVANMKSRVYPAKR